VLDQPVDPAAAAVAGESAVQSGPYPAPNLPRAQCIAHFTSFALHVMTGKRTSLTLFAFHIVISRHSTTRSYQALLRYSVFAILFSFISNFPRFIL
jgi:hypothetical protein